MCRTGGRTTRRLAARKGKHHDAPSLRPPQQSVSSATFRRAWPSHLCPAACTGVQQNTYATLRCQAGAIIANITKANYGELDVETCAPTGKCQTLGAARALNAACARRQVCLVNITDSLFGAEPCAGVQKILTVHDGRCQARSEEYVLEGRDWHSAQIPAWREHVLELIAAHENESLPLHALDVGCGEGSAATWILDEAVRHPASSLTAVDTFEESTTSGGGDPVSRFLQNVGEHSLLSCVPLGLVSSGAIDSSKRTLTRTACIAV